MIICIKRRISKDYDHYQKEKDRVKMTVIIIKKRMALS